MRIYQGYRHRSTPAGVKTTYNSSPKLPARKKPILTSVSVGLLLALFVPVKEEHLYQGNYKQEDYRQSGNSGGQNYQQDVGWNPVYQLTWGSDFVIDYSFYRNIFRIKAVGTFLWQKFTFLRRSCAC